jgi:hypothetical protein
MDSHAQAAEAHWDPAAKHTGPTVRADACDRGNSWTSGTSFAEWLDEIGSQGSICVETVLSEHLSASLVWEA